MDEWLAPELEGAIESGGQTKNQRLRRDAGQALDIGFNDSDVEDPEGSIKSHEMRGFRKRWNQKRLRSLPSCPPSPSLLEDGYEGGPEMGNRGLQEEATRQAASSADNQASVTNSFLTGMKVNTPMLPWESDWLAPIFGDPSAAVSLGMPSNWDPSFVKPQEEILPGATPAVQKIPDFSIERCVMNKVDRTYLEDKEVQFGKALTKLRFFMELVAGHCRVAEQLDKEQTVEAQNDILAAIIGTRSPNTTLKRVNALLAFYRWTVVAGEETFSPLSEASAWAYVRSLSVSQAAPTRATSFVQALRFAEHVLQVDGAAACVASRRITGSAELQLATKKPTRQARPLTVEEVRSLHVKTQDKTVPLSHRLIAAHLLLMLYTRSRNSDLAHVHEVMHDGGFESGRESAVGYIQISTRHHKAAKTAEKKNLLLPILASSVGVTNDDWITRWIKLRKEASLPVSGMINSALQPAPDLQRDGMWMTRPLSCSEVTLILRSMLQSSDRDLTSHSLKVSGLSWSAKAEIPREQRRLLGRHASSLQDADSVYSRDLAFAPVQAFGRMIALIRDGRFFPDNSRDLFFKSNNPMVPGTPLPRFQPRTPAMPVEQVTESKEPGERSVPLDFLEPKEEIQIPVHALDPGETISVTESESTTSTSGMECINSSDEDKEGDQQLGSVPDPLRQLIDAMVRNEKTKTIHSVADIGYLVTDSVYANHEILQGQTTKCGRATQSGYVVIKQVDDWTLKCRVCFRGCRQPEQLFGGP